METFLSSAGDRGRPPGFHSRRLWSAAIVTTIAAVGTALTSGCATAPRPVSKIVNGHVVVTRSVSPDAYEHVTRALLYQEEQRWDDAARELQRALPFDDDAAETRAQLADLFVRLHRLDDAADQVRLSLEIAQTVEGYLAAAHVAEARHDQKAALAQYRAASSLALSDENPDAIESTHLALADAQLAVLDVAAAYDTIRMLRDASGDSVRARIELGSLAWVLGRLPEAEAALTEALRLEPAQVDARVMLAALLAATGRTQEAKAAFRETLERAEDPIEIAEMFLRWLVARGDKTEAADEADRLTPDIVDEGNVESVIRIERAAGRTQRAKAAAEQAIKKGAGPAWVALLVAGAMADAKDRSGAGARLLSVPKGAPAAEFIESRLRAAEILREGAGVAELEQAGRALDAAATAIASIPTPASPTAPSVDLHQSSKAAAPHDWTTDLAVGRALLDEKRGDTIRATRTLEAALEKDPDNSRLLLVRAAVDERRGEWRRALTLAEKILADDPRQIEALNFHGYVSVEHESHLPEAVRRLQVAMALDPGAGGIVDSLGWAYLRAGDLTRATELLTEADRLEPGDPEILSHLADLFARQHDIVHAIATYRRALQRDPSERLVREINTRLRALEAKSAAER
jgi:tetratricopeptide (TPR) repeat protein